ncbi:unnamed protein product, partial [Ectocarpus sp. 4 AP-2014]
RSGSGVLFPRRVDDSGSAAVCERYCCTHPYVRRRRRRRRRPQIAVRAQGKRCVSRVCSLVKFVEGWRNRWCLICTLVNRFVSVLVLPRKERVLRITAEHGQFP